MATDWLASLLGPYSGQGSSVPSSLADLSGFDIGEQVKDKLASLNPDLTARSGQIVQGDLTPPNLMTRAGVTLQAPALQSLVALRRRFGLPVFNQISSSYRTMAQQRALYAQKPGIAAPPGQSLHQQGRAIDINSGWIAQHPEVRRWLVNNGWYQFDPSKEPWHFSYGTTG
jgi:hypothetical protein